MANILRFPRELTQIDQFGVFSDFAEDQLDALFVDTITDTGTVLMGDAAGGVATLTPSDGTVADNDEAYLASANEVFLVAAGKPIYAAASLKFAEANTDDANIAFGLQNAVGANSIVDDGAGLKVSGSCIGIFKVDGGTVWKCVSSINGTSTVSTSTATAGGTAFQKLEIEVIDFTGTQMKVVFKLDGIPLKDSTTGLDIVHTIAVASATEMQLFAGVKNGGANLETLNVDWMGAWQLR